MLGSMGLLTLLEICIAIACNVASLSSQPMNLIIIYLFVEIVTLVVDFKPMVHPEETIL